MRGPEKACKEKLSLSAMRPRGVSLPLGNSCRDADTKEADFDSDQGSLAWPLGVGEDGGGGKGHSKTEISPIQRPPQAETSPGRDLPRTETSPGQRPPRAETSPEQRPPQAETSLGRDLPRTEMSPGRDLPGCRTQLAEQFPVPRDNGMKTRIKLSIFSKFLI